MVALLIAFYSGAQFATNLFWGRASDSIGRRPVMLLASASTCVGTFGFGFSQSIPAMFAFRLVPGLLNGAVVVVRTIIGEITTGRENKASQISYVIGPIIGGYLAQPCHRFLRLCEDKRLPLLREFPFALPSIIVSILSALALVVGNFFIEESLDKKTMAADSERSPLLAPDSSEEEMVKETSPGWRDILTAPIIHIVLSYFLMTLHTACFDQIFPAYLATRPVPSRLLFHLNGGLSLPASTVANFISGAGAVSIVLMLGVFPPVSARISSKTSLRLSLLLYPFTYFALPYLALLPLSSAWARILSVSAVACAKVLAFVFSSSETAILLNACAPEARTLEFVNGLGQAAAAGGRAIGPAVMGLFVELGSKVDCSALGWYYLALVPVIGAVRGCWVVDASIEEQN
ncbi:major facilitator superfamily domain-containing protein [Hypoxylon sp. FL1150]|nr:major facilitator superfamily domain-containing protein [Hypoxylon sp. FL1150]